MRAGERRESLHHALGRLLDRQPHVVRRGVLLICQPSVLTRKLMQYFSTSARVTDMGTVYLIRIYFVALASVTLVIIATLHCSSNEPPRAFISSEDTTAAPAPRSASTAPIWNGR